MNAKMTDGTTTLGFVQQMGRYDFESIDYDSAPLLQSSGSKRYSRGFIEAFFAYMGLEIERKSTCLQAFLRELFTYSDIAPVNQLVVSVDKFAGITVLTSHQDIEAIEKLLADSPGIIQQLFEIAALLRLHEEVVDGIVENNKILTFDFSKQIADVLSDRFTMRVLAAHQEVLQHTYQEFSVR